MKTELLSIPGYEKVIKAELLPNVFSIIAIHSTNLGPALGGVRLYPYQSLEDTLTDVLRLSEGMSYKAALANLPLGGGKAVIMGDPELVKSKALFEAFGGFVETLNGQYITAKDVGIEIPDLDTIATKSIHVVGTSRKGSGGDPSPITAYGVYKGIKAAAKFKFKNDSLSGKRVIIQGMGHVGYSVAKYLRGEDAKVFATDLHQDKLAKFASELGLTALSAEGWQATEADIFCPCAMGATVNKQTIAALKANGIKIIAGGANNQLLDPFKDGQRLRDAGITYAPDYVINAGGLISVFAEIGRDYDLNFAMSKTDHIYDVLLEIFERADREDRPTAIISRELAREKIGLK